MSPERKERVAEILVDAFLSRNDAETAKRHGCAIRTLQNYRARLDQDAELVRIFREKKAKASEGWADEVPGAMRAAVAFLRKAAEEGDHTDPDMVHSVAGGMKLLNEVAMTWKFLEEKLKAMPQSATPPAPRPRLVQNAE